MKKKQNGFSLLEVSIAVAIAASVGGAIYQLQLISLNNSKKLVIRQLVSEYSDDLLSKMIVQMNFKSKNGNASSNRYFEAGTYGDGKNSYVTSTYTTYTNTKDCKSSGCDDNEMGWYLLNKWKQNVISKSGLPEANIRVIICRDYKLGIPTMDSPNCDNLPNNPLALKVVWKQSELTLENSKLADRNDNYLIYRIPGK